MSNKGAHAVKSSTSSAPVTQAPAPAKQSCGNCRFAVAGEMTLFCRRFPPAVHQPIAGGTSNPAAWLFPARWLNDWCGEHQAGPALAIQFRK